MSNASPTSAFTCQMYLSKRRQLYDTSYLSNLVINVLPKQLRLKCFINLITK